MADKKKKIISGSDLYDSDEEIAQKYQESISKISPAKNLTKNCADAIKRYRKANNCNK